MDNKFRHPSEMEEEKDKREPISARIKATSKELLENAATKQKKPLAWLIAHILEDYANWLRDHPRR